MILQICSEYDMYQAGMWKRRKRSYFNGSGSSKSVALPLPHHSKKHTANNLLDVILFNLLDIILQC